MLPATEVELSAGKASSGETTGSVLYVGLKCRCCGSWICERTVWGREESAGNLLLETPLPCLWVAVVEREQIKPCSFSVEAGKLIVWRTGSLTPHPPAPSPVGYPCPLDLMTPAFSAGVKVVHLSIRTSSLG